MKRISIFLLSIIVISSTQMNNSWAVSKAACRIEVSDAHLSTQIFEQSGKRAVKVDAYSICDLPQSKVALTVELWKFGSFSNYKLAATTVNSPGTTLPGKRVNNFGTFLPCKNSVATRFFGIAYSKAYLDGKWQYARHVQSKEIFPLPCGT
jgi:hypothetical protein